MPESKFFYFYKNEHIEGYKNPKIEYVSITNLSALNKLMKLLEDNQKQIDFVNKGFKNLDALKKKQEDILNEAFFSK